MAKKEKLSFPVGTVDKNTTDALLYQNFIDSKNGLRRKIKTDRVIHSCSAKVSLVLSFTFTSRYSTIACLALTVETSQVAVMYNNVARNKVAIDREGGMLASTAPKEPVAASANAGVSVGRPRGDAIAEKPEPSPPKCNNKFTAVRHPTREEFELNHLLPPGLLEEENDSLSGPSALEWYEHVSTTSRLTRDKSKILSRIWKDVPANGWESSVQIDSVRIFILSKSSV